MPVKLDKKYFVSEDEGAADISVKTEIKDGFAFAFRDNDSPCIAHYACGGEDVRYYTSEKEFCDIFKPCSKTGLMEMCIRDRAYTQERRRKAFHGGNRRGTCLNCKKLFFARGAQ